MIHNVSMAAEDVDVDHIKILAVTWNLAGGCPTIKDLDLIF